MKRYIILLAAGLPFLLAGMANAESIYEIQHNETTQGIIGCYPSPLLLQNVNITGVVMAVNPSNSKQFYIQDADSLWSGIFVTNSGQAVSRGDSVSLNGQVSEDDFGGYTYLTGISGLTIHSAGAVIYEPKAITTGMLSQTCNDSAEAYEGMLVKISALTVTQVLDEDGRWKVDDGSGAMYIGNDYYIYNALVEDTILSITGVVGAFEGTGGIRYVIIPRDAGDLQLPAGNRRPRISNVSLAPSAPTSDDEITITATITDESQIATAQVLYGLNDNTTPTVLTMSNIDSTYTAIIPPTDSAGWLFYRVSATDDSAASSTTELDSVQVTGVTSMADIQDNPTEWEGQTVTCQGVVTIGIDVIQTGRLNAYFQDNSGRGLNLFSFNPEPDYAAYIQRGIEILATGTITVYQGRTELEDPVITFIDSSQTLPAAQVLSTGQAAEQNWDGTRVLVTGDVISVGSESGGGRNVLVNDGSGELTVRVWTTTGIDVSGIVVGQEYTFIGVGGDYQGSKQIVPGYDDEIFAGSYVPGGVGVATIAPATVHADQRDLTETIMVTADSAVTLNAIKIVIPTEWSWENTTATGIEYYGEGIDSANVLATIDGNSIRLNGTSITPSASGYIKIKELKSPVVPGYYTFRVQTSFEATALEEIAKSPQVAVEGAKEAFVEVPAKVLIPDYGEKMPITYAAPNNSEVLIQVYDVEGTLIATLFDEEYDATQSEVVWDGRDRLKEIVPIGVYICYVEATERPSGRVTTARAPIVVAIPLK